jgi:hypothetical protein
LPYFDPSPNLSVLLFARRTQLAYCLPPSRPSVRKEKEKSALAVKKFFLFFFSDPLVTAIIETNTPRLHARIYTLLLLTPT